MSPFDEKKKKSACFVEFNGIKKVVQLDSCEGFLIILWAISRSTKSGRHPYKRGTGVSFPPFI